MPKFLTVIGNRPQFVKAAAVSHRLRAVADEVLVHTGQHYDEALSRVFFEELDLPAPEYQLDLGGGTNTAQTARMLEALEPLMREERPDAVLVYGDTNSTLAGALAELLLDPDRVAALGLAARERSVRLFGFGRSVDEFERVYAEALG